MRRPGEVRRVSGMGMGMGMENETSAGDKVCFPIDDYQLSCHPWTRLCDEYGMARSSRRCLDGLDSHMMVMNE